MEHEHNIRGDMMGYYPYRRCCQRRCYTRGRCYYPYNCFYGYRGYGISPVATIIGAVALTQVIGRPLYRINRMINCNRIFF